MPPLRSTDISRTHSPYLIRGYQLEKRVGNGGMGEVYKATQLSLNRTVAIKLLSPQLAQDKSFIARFDKEAAALASLHHPNIVSIIDKGRTPTTYYLVMEFVDGPSLRERMRMLQEDSDEALWTMLQLCKTVEYAHGRDVLHRDLKPENILFDDQAGGIPKVTNFGLASFLEDSSSRVAPTGTHMAAGTPSYMAPEQRVDAKSADKRADIFALGLIFYEMLVGELPAGSFDLPSRRKPGLDPRLDDIIVRCLKQIPADRYPNATELIADLLPLVPNKSTTDTISRTHSPHLIRGYRLEKCVGSGGMGEVHKATQLSLNRTVAIKLLSPQLAQDKSFIARFDKEAAALASLHHPNIVSIIDKGRTPTTYYLVMEFVDGPSLRERMRMLQEDSDEALWTMLQLCKTIEYTHGRGVIHRDLKPENILFDDQAGGIPKVTDFGVASFLEDTSTRFALTGTNMAMGTLSYMAPEQRVDAKSADGRADIFALGLIFYEMLVGELPAGSFDLPSRRKPGLDPRLDDIIVRCLKQIPADRYPNATELIADLLPLVSKSTTERSGTLGRTQSLKRVVRFIGLLMATLMVLAAMGVLGVAYLRGQDTRTTVTPGAALTADLGMPSTQQIPSKLEIQSDEHRVNLGEGPNLASLLVTGRRLDTWNKALVFPPEEGECRTSLFQPEEQPCAGLVRLDMIGLEGGTARLSAQVSAQGPEPTLEMHLRDTVFGKPSDPQAALLLVGSTGNYVALVYNGAGAPLQLEWSLGEHRGSRLGFNSPPNPAVLWLEVEEGGILKAYAGASKSEKRQLTEPFNLGTKWQKEFGDSLPKPAFGCIAGTCRAENFSYQVEAKSSQTPSAAAPKPPPARGKGSK